MRRKLMLILYVVSKFNTKYLSNSYQYKIIDILVT